MKKVDSLEIFGFTSLSMKTLSLTFVLFFAATTLFAEASRITLLQVTGNKKTKSNVIREMSGLSVGDELTEKLLKEAREKILSSGLFESVEISKEVSRDSASVRLNIRVLEKMSWFIAPTLQSSENSLSGGFVFGESNLFGYNKKALVFADYGPSAKRFVTAYRDPSLMNSQFTLALDTVVKQERIIDYINRQEGRRVELLEFGANFLPGYRWSPKFVSSVGFYYRRVDEDLKEERIALNLPNPALADEDRDIAIVVRFEYDNTINHNGLQGGAKISLESSLSDNRFYSDFDYAKQELRFFNGIIFGNREYNWQNSMSVQLAQNPPHYREYTSGGRNLRGYIEKQFRGDTKYAFSETFLYPIHHFDRFILRGALFYDSHVIYLKDQKFSKDDWKNGIGGGLRLYMKGVVIPLIGFDAGWGIEDRTYGTYLNIGGSF